MTDETPETPAEEAGSAQNAEVTPAAEGGQAAQDKTTQETADETAESASGEEGDESAVTESAAAPESAEAPESTAAPESEATTDTEPGPEDAPAPASIEETAAQLEIGGEAGDGEEAAEPAVAPVIRGRVDRFGVAMGTGRRKSAVARVRIKPGDGQLSINERSLEAYFYIERDRQMVQAPLEAAEQLGKVDVWVRVDGGGTTGQTGAIVLGIARALQVMDPSLHHPLSSGGYLTRDGRMVERKKYGYKKARKSFQFSKR